MSIMKIDEHVRKKGIIGWGSNEVKEWGNWQQQRHGHGWQGVGICEGRGTPAAACATEREDLAVSAMTLRSELGRSVR